METIYDRTEDLGEYIPEPDDDRIICRCEEVTKGEIRKAVHDGMYTITEIRRYLRCGMGLCQGQTCAKLVKGIVARELGVSPAVLEPAGVPQTGMQIHCLRRLAITGQPENWALHFTPGKKWWN